MSSSASTTRDWHRPAWPTWHLHGEENERRPMLIFRWIVLLLMVGGLLCFAMYIGTGNQRWRDLGVRIVKWAVVAGLGFFAVLILERMVMIL